MKIKQLLSGKSKISIVWEDLNPEIGGESINWAVDQLMYAFLEHALVSTSIYVESTVSEFAIIISVQLRTPDDSKKASLDNEAFTIERERAVNQTIITLASSGIRGLVYAILELSDQIRYANDPIASLHELNPITEKAAMKIRSISRMFVSEEEDKPWFHNKAFWDEYLTEMARHRFNRFNLAFGMGYDYGHDPDIRDNYLYFAYPFLLNVPGFNVTVKGLPEGEAQLNLVMLNYIGEEAKRRGMDFHLGIWTHAIDVPESPNPRYVIKGLNKDNHAAYCRDALELLLESCPSIDGLTLRVHYESGIPEPAHEFWRVALSGVAACERPIKVDIHSKGADFAMIQMVQDSTGKALTVSPKYWAEHLGLPYHPTANREREMPDADFQGSKYAAITAGSRKVTRYGYADFLKEDRDYAIVYRIWPGTQRFLLWGDPLLTAAYSQAAIFSRADGMEIFEPLSFKGRKTSGAAGGRELYADGSLQLQGKDWIKYGYTYLLWGRMLYNPDTDSSVWQRYLQHEYGSAANSVEQALAQASRILPLITVAHHPSSANVDYWPELYTNLPIIKTEPFYSDYDLPEPKTFGAASPLDPGLFASINEYADLLVSGKESWKVTPLEVSQRIKAWADLAESHIKEAEEHQSHNRTLIRVITDVKILVSLGRFFAQKFQAGLAYELFERTHELNFLVNAIEEYEAAKAAWEQIIVVAGNVYRKDIAFGHKPHMRGHWIDRLPAISKDIELMKYKYEQELAARSNQATNKTGINHAHLRGLTPVVQHTSAPFYKKGIELGIALILAETEPDARIQLHYRHVNQAERFEIIEMIADKGQYFAKIPASYADSVYPLMYFFVLNQGSKAWMAPGFNDNMSNSLYYIVHSG